MAALVTAVDREAPSSGSSSNLGQGPWGERHPSSVGPALGSEGHYADTAVVDLHDGSSQYGAVKADRTLARTTTDDTPTLAHTNSYCLQQKRSPKNLLFGSVILRVYWERLRRRRRHLFVMRHRSNSRWHNTNAWID